MMILNLLINKVEDTRVGLMKEYNVIQIKEKYY